MAKIIRIPSAFVIDTKVVGVSKENTDGTSRQEIIKDEVVEEDKIQLQPEPDNAYDEYAVKVLTQSGKQIGYLSSEVAARVSNAMINEAKVYCKASWVSGVKMLGVGLRIELET